VAIAAAVIITTFCIAAGVWLGVRLAARLGAKPLRELPPQTRRRFWLFLGLATLPTIGVVIAFASGHPGIGIAILVAVYILPTFITTLLPIRRARREAAAARLRRSGA
jgi:fatty acid desaturase